MVGPDDSDDGDGAPGPPDPFPFENGAEITDGLDVDDEDGELGPDERIEDEDAFVLVTGPDTQFFAEVEPDVFEVQLPDELRQVLGTLVDNLRSLLLMGDRDGLRRLFPTAYPEDEKLNEDYVRLVHDQLLESRLDAIDRVEQSLDAKTLTAEQLSAWMRALNDIRLILGTQLDVSENDPREGAADHPDAPVFELYGLLGWLVGHVVDALSGTLPEAGED